jgi:hypothetical protein
MENAISAFWPQRYWRGNKDRCSQSFYCAAAGWQVNYLYFACSIFSVEYKWKMLI